MTADPLRRWADLLAAWEIPAAVLARATDSPWVLPRGVFERRADAQIAEPIGSTHLAAISALGTPGTVLDVGAAAGASSLPLVGRAPVTGFVAVDADAELLDGYTTRAAALGARASVVHGRWPDVRSLVDTVDVVIAGNVVYNVPDLEPFVRALTGHARRLVILETTRRHPLIELNPFWRRFHGIARPDGPTVDDLLAVLRRMGLRPWVSRWRRPPEAEYASFADLVDVVRRRLCLPADAAGEVAAALRESGVDPDRPPDLGSSGRDLVMLAWQPLTACS